MGSPSRDHAPNTCAATPISAAPWLPIESAPKDGTIIWLRSPLYEPDQPFAWDRARERWWTKVFAVAATYDGWWSEDAEQPTHWRPLEVAPEEASPRQVSHAIRDEAK